MPYPLAIKALAYANDPTCWKSYSGKTPHYKRIMDGRRSMSLGTAVHQMMESILSPKQKDLAMGEPYFSYLFIDHPKSKLRAMPPMKVSMLLHFDSVCEPYAPEKTRTSRAYTKFVKELLRDALIERPTEEERYQTPGWAYRTTDKGRTLVTAICNVPNPVAQTEWVIPK